MINGQRVLAVIIGRAGSKGLPGKNAMPLPGVPGALPMIAYAIRHAKEADTVDRILVSTDGEAIARIAAEHAVEVIMRPAALASDTATVASAVRHAVESAGEKDRAALVVILYANVPVRPSGLIDRAIAALASTRADSVQSYCGVGKYHPYWMVRLDAAGRVTANVENAIDRRQDLPPLFIPDGGVIAVTASSLLAADPSHPHAFLGADRRGIHNPPGSVIDVDTPVDALLASAVIMEVGGTGGTGGTGGPGRLREVAGAHR